MAVDLIIEVERDRIVLIRRRNPPYGWALPGGFVEYGESLEAAAVREAKEETGLDIELLRQLHTYSDPARDPRGHTVSTVFIARAQGSPQAGDDAGDVRTVKVTEPPSPLAFDHEKILADYLAFGRSGRGDFGLHGTIGEGGSPLGMSGRSNRSGDE